LVSDVSDRWRNGRRQGVWGGQGGRNVNILCGGLLTALGGSGLLGGTFGCGVSCVISTKRNLAEHPSLREVASKKEGTEVEGGDKEDATYSSWLYI
jgi:hypothetical protein